MVAFTVLIALLPLLPLGLAQPAHDSIRRVNHAQHHRLAERADIGQRLVRRAVEKKGAKRGTCRVRGAQAPALQASSSQAVASSAAPAESSVAPSIIGAEHLAKPTSSSAAWSAAPTSESIAPSSTSQWTEPSAAPTPAPAPPSGDNSGGILQFTDPTCGYSNASPDEPNGSQDWLNCGLSSGGGWTPPAVHLNELIAKPLSADGIFSPCANYIGIFNDVGAQLGIPPIMIASFAMQESTCNQWVTGKQGEVGLMQITPDKCPQGKDCYDPWTNIHTGANYFKSRVDANGGNALISIGEYNGWRHGLTYGDATAAAGRGQCNAQNNLDYITQFCNGWMQNKNGYDLGHIKNIAHC